MIYDYVYIIALKTPTMEPPSTVVSIPFRLTETQTFVYGKDVHTIVKPTPGCVFARIDRSTGMPASYVVVKTRQKKNGQNKGVIDAIFAKPIIKIVRLNKSDVTVFYDNNDLSIDHQLTNHGNWWTGLELKSYEYHWNVYRTPSSPSLKPIQKTIDTESVIRV